MQRIAGYENVQPDERKQGGGGRLPLDNYICRIVDVKFGKSKKTNRDMLTIYFDIAVGPYTDYYMKRLAKDMENNPEAKWKQAGIYYQMADDKAAGSLKLFIKCIEESNKGYTWNWNEQTLVDKKFAAQMCGEEKSFNGHDYIDVRVANIYPVDDFATMPAAYMRKPKNDDSSASQPATFGEAVNNGGEDIPF